MARGTTRDDYVKWSCGLCPERYFISLKGRSPRRQEREYEKAVDALREHMESAHPELNNMPVRVR